MLALTQAPSISSDQLQSPRWLVTNGTTTVGPVHTELLLRGYMGGRIPEHCQVRDVRWGAWRPLDGIREIGGLKRRLARDAERPLNLREAASRLPVTRDVGELLTAALELAVQTLDANAGLVHRYRSPSTLPVTSSVYGVPHQRLGEVLPATDPAYLLALRGKSLCNSPRLGVAERLIAERLQHDGPLSSVAMTPIIAAGRLVALLELGRTSHVFRMDDADDLTEFAAHVARRIG
jgi:hypothetical protein